MGCVYLGVDIGTTSAKCLAVDEDGQTLALAQHAYAMAHPSQGWAEQDPEDYWQALADVVRLCVAECERKGYRPSDVASMAMSTQGDTLIVTDDSGTPIYPAINWMDARADREFAELLSEADGSFWYRETGSPLTALSSACAIRWIARNMPEVAAAHPRYCYVPDYLAKRLCGRFVTDVPSASWTPLFSPSKRDWSPAVLDVLGLPRAALPSVAESGEVIGELLPTAAAELGLTPQTKLVAGAFDQAAAAYGSGATSGGRSVLSCGTAWVLYSVSAKPVHDGAESLCTCCHTHADEWGLVLPFTGGAAYDWLNGVLSDSQSEPNDASEPLIFIPHLYGGLSPDWRKESRGSLVGLTMSHTQADIRLAMMRGIGFETRRNLDATLPYTGKAKSIRMVGGACKSEIWPQLIANITNCAVEVSDCVESACYGAAKLAAGLASESWTNTWSVRRLEPSDAAVASEYRLYQRYLQCYEELLRIFMQRDGEKG